MFLWVFDIMLTVHVPPWVLSHQIYEIEVELGPGMPQAQLNTPRLKVTGYDLVRSSILSGRPWHMLHNPLSLGSQGMAQWRIYSSLGILEPTPNRKGLIRPPMFQHEVDESEKKNLTFSLGGTMAHLYFEKELGLNWLAHYSLASNSHYITRAPNAGKVEPDYIGIDRRNGYVVAEAKGTTSLSNRIRNDLNAKRQTKVVTHVNRSPVSQFGIATESGNQQPLSMYVCDPEVSLDLPTFDTWRRLYIQHLDALLGSDESTSLSNMLATHSDDQNLEQEDPDLRENRNDAPSGWLPMQMYSPKETVGAYPVGDREEDHSEFLMEQLASRYEHFAIFDDSTVLLSPQKPDVSS